LGRRVSDGRSLRVTVPENTTVTAGQFWLLDGALGMAVQSVTTGAGVTAQLTLNIEPAEYETSQIDVVDAFAKGDKIYWDATNKRFTTVPSDGIFCGIVTTAKDGNSVIWLWFAPQQTRLTRATTVAAVASADGVAAAGANPTKAEFDVVVTLANETKAQLNAALAALKAGYLMA
jgi:hypothetical protein